MIAIETGCRDDLPAQADRDPQQCLQALHPDHGLFCFSVDGHPRALIARFFDDFDLAHWSSPADPPQPGFRKSLKKSLTTFWASPHESARLRTPLEAGR